MPARNREKARIKKGRNQKKQTSGGACQRDLQKSLNPPIRLLHGQQVQIAVIPVSQSVVLVRRLESTAAQNPESRHDISFKLGPDALDRAK